MAHQEPKYVPALQKRYREEIAPALMKEFGYKSVMEVPTIQKIVVNMGLGEGVQNPKSVDLAVLCR